MLYFMQRMLMQLILENIVVWANDLDITVILICNIHLMDSDVWYDSGHNYDNYGHKMFLHYQVYMLSLEMITQLLFWKEES